MNESMYESYWIEKGDFPGSNPHVIVNSGGGKSTNHPPPPFLTKGVTTVYRKELVECKVATSDKVGEAFRSPLWEVQKRKKNPP